MAGEERGNQSYYYTKTRIGNKVVSNYVGTGMTANLAARLDYMTALQREICRRERQ